jgi:hypothetical protein
LLAPTKPPTAPNPRHLRCSGTGNGIAFFHIYV